MPHSDPPAGSIRLFPDSEITDLWAPGDNDTLFACLANHRRRLLIDCVSENSGPLPVERLVEQISERETEESAPSDETRAEITITLLHNHLPKMDEADGVEFDREASTVSEGANFDVAAALLEAV